MAECAFCGEKMKPGTGVLFVKKDGTPLFFCSRKCEKNLLKLKRKPVSTKWTLVQRNARQAGKQGKKVKEKKAEEKKEKPKKRKKKRTRKKKKR